MIEGHPHRLLVEDALGHEPVVAGHLAVVGRVDDPGVVQEAPALERIEHEAHRVVDDRDVGGVGPAHVADDVLGHGRRVRQAQERVEEMLVAAGPLEGRAGGRRGHGDVDVAVAGHRLGRRVPGVVRPGEPDEQKEGLGPVVLFEPAHRLGPVPGVDVGREGQGHRGGVPHGHDFGGVAPVLVLPLVAAVGDVPPVGLEQALRGQKIGVARRLLAHELVARLEDLGESQRLQAGGHVVDVVDGDDLVAVEVGLAQQRGVVARLA